MLSIVSKYKNTFLPIVFSVLLLFLGVNAFAEQINIEKLNFELGVKNLKQNSLYEAVKYFKLVLNKNPDNVEAHYNIAVAYKKMGRHEESVKHFDRVVTLLNNPSTLQPGVIQASEFPRQNRQEKTPERFDVYTEVKEKENDYIDLGDMHADNGQYKEAIEYYNLALGVNPYNDNTYFKVCKSYMDINDPINAEPYINKAVELDPGNARYKYYRKKVSTRIADDYDSEFEKREQLVLENFNNPASMAEFEKKYYEKELYEGQWIADKPKTEFNTIDNAFEQDNRRRQLAQKNRIEKHYRDKEKREILQELSRDGFTDLYRKQSQELDYLDLGDLYFDNREYDSAIEYYKIARDINPNNDYTYYKLSQSYIKQGQFEKADEYIEKALELSEKNRKYVFVKNQITDRIARHEEPAGDEFYSPAENTQEPFYVDRIAKEPDKEPVDDFLAEKPSFMDRVKSGVSLIKMPKLKMLKISKLPGKIFDPLEGKVEKYSEKTKKKHEKHSEEREDEVFNRPAGYYEYENKQPGREYEQYDYDEKDFDKPMHTAQEKQDFRSAGYYNRKGIEFFKRDNLSQAEEYFKKAVELSPMYAKGYNNLANIEVKRRNYEKAKEYALKAIEIDPDYPEGYYNLAVIHKKAREFDQELYYLDKAIETDPRYYEAYFTRGLAYYKKGDYDRAKFNFGQALKYKNDHFLAAQNLGIIYANELNYEMAERYLNLAIKFDKNNPQTYFHLGVVRKNSNKLVSAIEDFQKSIELDPADYKTYIMLSKCYDMDSQPLMALNVLKDAAKKHPENAEIYNYLGLLSLKFDKYEEACLAFRKAAEKNPNRPIYHYNLSQCYLTLGKRKDSNYAFQRAVGIIPTTVQDYTDLAEIFFDKGMASYAIQVLKEGISGLKKNDYLFLVLSDFYERTGAIKAARDILEEYLSKTAQENAFSLLVEKRLNKLESL